MPASIIGLLVLNLVWIAAWVWLIVVAFRVRPWWALVVVVPFGALVFRLKYREEALLPLRVIVICGAIIASLVGSRPHFIDQFKLAGAACRQMLSYGGPAATPAPVALDASELPEMPDVEMTPVAKPETVVDVNAVRAAYARHNAELTGLYQQLARERATLTPGKTTADFNAKAARYQQALQSLADEKTKLDALERVEPSPMKNGAIAQAGG